MLKQEGVTISIGPPKMMAFRSPFLWLILLIGFSTTFVVWRLSDENISKQTQERFDSRAAQVVTAVEQRMHAYEQVLRGGVGLFRTRQTITRHQWHEYVENADLAKNYPGIQNFAVDFPIPAAEKDAHLAEVRAEGHPEYSITPEQPERPVYHSLVYVEPFGGRNLRAFGFDMYTNPVRREAMDRAIDMGLPSVSRMVKLAQETNEDVQNGFIYCLPVYHIGRLVVTPDQRRAAFRALVCGGFRVDDLMHGIFGARTSDLELAVFDGAITQETQMYNSRHGDKITVSTFSRTVPVEVGGRTWNLRVSANQAFINAISWTQSQLVMVSGTLLSFALFLGIGLWLDIERRTQEKVRRNSHIFNAVQDSVKESLLVINKSGIVISSNPTAAQRLALTPDQLIGQSIFEVLPPDVVAKWRAMSGEVIRSGRDITFEDALKGRDYLNNLYPVLDSRNQCEAFVNVGTDITDRRRVVKELKAAEEQFRGLVEQSIAGIYIIQDGTLVYANPRAAEIFGQGSVNDLIGTDPLIWIVEADRGKVGENIRMVIEGEAQRVEFTFGVVLRDGKATVIGTNAARASHLGKTAVIGMMQDVTVKVRNEGEIADYVAQLKAAFSSTVDVVAALVEMRDPYTAGHERRVANLAVAIGGELGMDSNRQEGLRVAASMHDIGKITIPAEILSKPGKLNQSEYALIQGHARAGYDVLKGMAFPWPVAQIALQHHERMDGSGYPQGLKGEAILIEARILAVADMVEAMSSHRPYRAGLGVDKALAEIERGRGAAFDPAVVDACLKAFRQDGFAFHYV